VTIGWFLIFGFVWSLRERHADIRGAPDPAREPPSGQQRHAESQTETAADEPSDLNPRS
jgi:hypothetical protein